MSLALVTALTALVYASSQPAVGADAPSGTGEDARHGRRNYNVPPGEYYTGRSPFTAGQVAPPATSRTAAPEPRAAAPAPAEQPAGPCQVINTGWVHMTKTMPREVVLGQEFMYELNPRAVACVGNVVVTDQIPAGTTYVRSEPKAEVVGNELVWKLGEMDPGQTIPLKVWVRADRQDAHRIPLSRRAADLGSN